MDEFLALCVEELKEHQTDGFDLLRPVLFVDRNDTIVTYRGGTINQNLKAALQGEVTTGCCRAVHFEKRAQDDYWIVLLLRHFPFTGQEFRLYPSNHKGIPDLTEKYIPCNGLLEEENALER